MLNNSKNGLKHVLFYYRGQHVIVFKIRKCVFELEIISQRLTQILNTNNIALSMTDFSIQYYHFFMLPCHKYELEKHDFVTN